MISKKEWQELSLPQKIVSVVLAILFVVVLVATLYFRPDD
jgi:flagellar biosynthesis/type III secretory pathway M-ring protein FliF/YscJ